MIIDFHTHILPGIDDGSRDTEMTAALLREEADQGVELIAATPHFYANRMSVEGFLDRRASALEKTERIRREADTPLPAVVCGAEVYYFRGIGQAESVPKLCVGATRTLLLEMPFEQWETPVLEDVKALQARGLRIVLAHVERYVALQKKREVWDRVMALDVLRQINAGSFVKHGGWLDGLLGRDKTPAFCLKFLREHPVTLIGSDCHNLTSRKPNLLAGREAIVAALGAEALAGTETAVLTALEMNG